ncbi:F0F1 ATP synthase subunit alpha, partial [bacterium]|nr:F0F1 ATP synthase subunit alpha [bacterium]
MAIVKEIGHINSFYQGVGKVTGLPNVFLNEVLIWENKKKAGIVIGYDQEFAEVLFFKPKEVDYSKPLFRTKTAFKIPVGESYLGRVVNGIGEPIDNLGKISGEQESVFRPAPPIIDRQPVSVPLSTGIKMIDTMLPLGRGQRELVIGDRKLGKSTIALDVVLNQK